MGKIAPQTEPFSDLLADLDFTPDSGECQALFVELFGIRLPGSICALCPDFSGRFFQTPMFQKAVSDSVSDSLVSLCTDNPLAVATRIDP